MKYPFHEDSSSQTFKNASALRINQTKAEEALWGVLRNRKLLGLKFRRQHPIDGYIVDFYCHSHLLVIEVDGRIHQMHDNPGYDRARDEHLASFGLRLIRFSNDEVLNDINGVLLKIKFAIASPLPSPLRRGIDE